MPRLFFGHQLSVVLEDDRGGVARLQRDLVGALDQRDPVADEGLAQYVVGVMPSAGRSKAHDDTWDVVRSEGAEE